MVATNTLIHAAADTAATVAIERGSFSRRFKIPADVVSKAIAPLPEEQRELIWWLYEHCRHRDLSKAELNRLLKKPTGNGYYAEDSIIQLLRGDRIRKGEPIDNYLEAIRPLRELEQRREEMTTSGFIETRLYKEIERRADLARARQRIFYVFGDSQIGKSVCGQEYQRRHNHGQTYYIDMPTGGALGKFVKALARAFNITERSNNLDRIMERIKESINSSMLLVIDNAHRCLRSRYKDAGLQTFTFIQEIFDTCRCGMLIFMTNRGRDELTKGSHAKELEQMWRRRIRPMQLPNVMPADDLALFAAAYGLPPADDEAIEVSIRYYDNHGKLQKETHEDSPLRLQQDVNQSEGLGIWISLLQDASDMAQEAGRPVEWGAVIKAYCQAKAEAEIYR